MSSTATEDRVWSQTRTDVIAGLRALANALEDEPRLPVPTLIQTVAPDEATVRRAARAYDAPVTERNGHTSTGVRFGPVSLHIFHVSDDRMAQWHRDTSYHGSVQP
jgi:hypothetical protein